MALESIEVLYMERQHYILFFLMLVLSIPLAFSQGGRDFRVKKIDMSIQVPTEGNSWLVTNVGTSQMQYEDFKNYDWVSTDAVVRTYFYLRKAGDLHIGFKGTVPSGSSTILATFQGKSKKIKLRDHGSEIVYIGSFNVPSAGYYFVDLQRTEKRGSRSVSPASLEFIALGGEATFEGVQYSYKGYSHLGQDYSYWGRRGPMAILWYEIPPSATDVRWFYTEVTVPEGNDVIGSFYEATGFKDGYFGMQVVSASERMILFSVWSPYETNDPASIPVDQRVQLISKGEHVMAQDFGNEGSGGQSYLYFNWESGMTYRFLLKGEPIGDNKTDYSAYFFDPKAEQWHFIAQWRRPLSPTSLTELYSFLENFDTTAGPITRMAYYNNQWVYDTNSTWHEITQAVFSAEFHETRLDYAGGYRKGDSGFYLKNCGFFDETTEINTYHTRPSMGKAPNIDFDALPRN